MGVVLSGMNEDEHIRENIKMACGTMPGSMTAWEKQVVYDVKTIYRDPMKVPCTGCN